MPTKIQTEAGEKLIEGAFLYPGMVERSNIIEKLRLWVYPSFQPAVSFTIGCENNEYYLRRVVWNHRVLTLTDEPQTYCCEVKINKSVLTEIVEKISSLLLPPFIGSSLIGIDGIRYGIEFGDFLQPSRLSWWGTPPKEWCELSEIYAFYIEKLNGLLPPSSIDIGPALTSCST